MFKIFLISLFNLLFQICSKEKFILKENDIIKLNQEKEDKIFRNLASDNAKKNLIIGTIKGYSWGVLKNFFISYITAGFKNCDLVMFADKISEETLSKIKLCGTIVLDIPTKHLGFQGLGNHRWKWYSDYVKENKEKYNMVFATDVRDTIFQKDIFQYYDNSKPFIGFNLEDITLRNPVNKYFIKKFCKTKEEYEIIADKRVICSGTIISSADIFIDFSNKLYELFINHTDAYDQGVLNYLIYSKKLFNDVMILKNNSGPVMTICVTKRKYINLDSNDNVLNFNGEIAAVVHQYDRKPDINMKFHKKFNDNILKKYYSEEKLHEYENKIKKEEKAKGEYKERIKIIKRFILFAFIIISLTFIYYNKAKKNGYCKKNEETQNVVKIKSKYFKKRKKRVKNYNDWKNTNQSLNSSERDINKSKDIKLNMKKYQSKYS